MDYSFSAIIQQVNKIDSSHIKDEIKLRRTGELFYLGSVCLLAQAEAALENAQQDNVDLTDTPIDNSFCQFLASLTQQSISTSFLQKYLKPQSRAKYQRETSVKIQSLTSSEAVGLFDLDLIEPQVISLAHNENINAWIERITKCLESNIEINTLPQISKATALSIAQVFISLLFGDFELLQSGDFYEGFAIEVRSRTS
ncbi:hypothetical protein [Pleurocapsa sp. PCC 7319]|uniref:hypothetical protein n=1 Tax=Pleurocapsa sp. PCC 7319 TaxID=118161 RepID=UPI000346A772|nr:hypothetical protein [Pleurocapsa sp. PCC 7319]